MGLTVAHAAGKLDHRELGAEHGSGLLQLANDRRIAVKRASSERRGAPAGGYAVRRGEKVLGAVGDAVEGAAILAASDLLLGALGLAKRPFPRDGHDRVQRRTVAFEPVQRKLSQLDRRDLSAPDELGEVPDRPV